MDEISQIYSVSQRKLDFLGKLRQDFQAMLSRPVSADVTTRHAEIPQTRSLPAADPQTCEWAINRIDGAISRVKADHEALPDILDDLQSSLHDVCLPLSLFVSD